MAEERTRVLYVDDEADVREVFAAVFGADFDVRLADGGDAALRLLEAGDIDVLVSDMRMEPLRGSELRARAFEQFPQTERVHPPLSPASPAQPKPGFSFPGSCGRSEPKVAIP